MNMNIVQTAGSLFVIALIVLTMLRVMAGRISWKELAQEGDWFLPVIAGVCMCAGAAMLVTCLLLGAGFSKEVFMKGFMIFLGVVLTGFFLSGAVTVTASIQQRVRIGE